MPNKKIQICTIVQDCGNGAIIDDATKEKVQARLEKITGLNTVWLPEGCDIEIVDVEPPRLPFRKPRKAKSAKNLFTHLYDDDEEEEDYEDDYDD